MHGPQRETMAELRRTVEYQETLFRWLESRLQSGMQLETLVSSEQGIQETGVLSNV